MNPMFQSQSSGSDVNRPVRKLVGQRLREPRGTSCMIWVVEYLNSQVIHQEIVIPVHYSGGRIYGELMAGLEPGEEREIVAITPNGILWAERSDPGDGETLYVNQTAEDQAGSSLIAPAEREQLSRRVSNKLRETERLAGRSRS